MNKEHIAIVFGLLLLGGFAWSSGASFNSITSSFNTTGKSLLAGVGTLIDKPAPVTLSGVGAKPVTITASSTNPTKDVTLASFALVSTEPTYVSNVSVNLTKTGPAVLGTASLYIGSQKLATAKIPTIVAGRPVVLQFPLGRNLELLSGDRRVLLVKADIRGASVTPSVFRASVVSSGIKGTPSSPLVVKGSSPAVPVTIKTAPAVVR